MDPRQILAAMAEVYATCTSYQDAGTVTTRYVRAGRDPRVTTQPFETAFVRPDRLRFEYRDRFLEEDPWGRCIVWASGADVRTWWHVRPGVEVEESLGTALAAATGVSGGSAHTIPALLMPGEVSGQRLTDMVEVVSLGDAALGEVACYRLCGRFAPVRLDPVAEARFFQNTGRLGPAESMPMTVWIDRGTLLVRRIEEVTRFETFQTEEVTTYEPRVGVVIPEESLKFDPPTADDAPVG